MQMLIGVGVKLGQFPTDVSLAVQTPILAPQVSEVKQDGWQAVHADAATVDAFGSDQVLTVQRPGFDVTGAPNVVNDQISVSSRLRNPFPNQDSLTDADVALSNFVYAGDVIAGATNNSTRLYPKPIAMWLNHDREHIKTEIHVLRLAVSHAYARNSQPVAAVKFIASDGISEVTQTVSDMDTAHYDASGLTVPHFSATLNFSTLKDKELVTVDAVIYPWVGEPFTISTDADPYPSPNLTTLRLWNDFTESYGTGYVYVNVDTGDDASGVVSVLATEAALSPFATIPSAVTALKAFNGTQFGRNNDVGGGIVRLAEGTHVHGSIKAQGESPHVPLVIEAADPATQATTVLTDGGSSIFNGIPAFLKLRHLTLRKTGGSVVFLDSGATSAENLLITENCIWDANATSYYGAWVYRVGRFTQINCEIGGGGDPKQGNSFSTEAIMVTAIGCQGCAGTITYHAVGCSDLPEFTLREALGARPAMTGVFLGWNTFTNGSTSNPIISVSAPLGPRGFAFVGNVVESWGAATNAGLRLNADSDVSITQNVVLQHNTIVGERANLLYLDGTENVEKSAYVNFNLFSRFNIKGDVFAGQGLNVGNWPVRYKVGWSDNASTDGSNNSSTYGPPSWLGELPSRGELVGIDPMWANDASHSGSGTGAGNYTPTNGSLLPVLTEEMAAYSFDLFGNALTSGHSRIGAVMQAV